MQNRAYGPSGHGRGTMEGAEAETGIKEQGRQVSPPALLFTTLLEVAAGSHEKQHGNRQEHVDP